MNNRLPPVYFYIPNGDWRDKIPEDPDVYWKDFGGVITPTIYGWTVQTYLRLKRVNFPCQLVSEIPDEGILLTYRRSVPEDFQPGENLFFVCFKSEQSFHPYAHIHIVGNPIEVTPTVDIPGPRYYMPHWPQPGLIPRDKNRGDRFERAAFFGESRNLAPELRSSNFARKIEELGLSWRIIAGEERHLWNDFSEVDAIVSVREFNKPDNFTWKPALKLYNAWLAGVPAILGQDSAFRNERRSELDYLEVASEEEVILAIKRLRDDIELRRAMIENGERRALEINPAAITGRWMNFMLDKAIPAYYGWRRASKLQKQLFFIERRNNFKLKDWRSRMRRLKGSITTPIKSLWHR